MGVMLKVSEVAKRLSVSLALCYRLITERIIPHHMIGKAIRVSEEQLQSYLDASKREGTESLPARHRQLRTRLKNFSL
jgi:excisionase family DNA binding protein